MMATKKQTRVEKLYFSPKADQLFAEAKGLFKPKQEEEATKYIVERLAPSAFSQKDKDKLEEMVYAGLT